MFTLPLGTFFGVKHLIKEMFIVDDFSNTICSVIAAVIIVNVIIAFYVRHAVKEMEEDNEFASQPPKEETKKTD